jgi:hypothetical protein
LRLLSGTFPSGVAAPGVDVEEFRRWIDAETASELPSLAPFQELVIDALWADAVECDVECGELKMLAG